MIWLLRSQSRFVWIWCHGSILWFIIRYHWSKADSNSGMTIMCAMQFAVIEFDLNNYSICLIVAAGINGFLGGTAAMLGVSFAFVSDVTSYGGHYVS